MDDVLEFYKNCTLCPHKCNVDRNKEFGFCKESSTPIIVWCGLHKGEEAPISGEKGSGMLFFRGCTLGCPTCQNIQISDSTKKDDFGHPYTIEEMSRAMLSLQKMGASTISFVTSEHFVPSCIAAIKMARENGLFLPTVFNTSGFMTKDTVKLLLPYIDIWLWDTKTLSSSLSKKYFGSEKYPAVEEEALEFLCENVNSDLLSAPYPKGIIVRHLVLPSHIEESKEVIRNFAHRYKDKCYFSLMYQFISSDDMPNELKVKLTKKDTEELENLLFSLDIENGFIQELSDEEEIWRPNFKNKNPFPSSFATSLE